MTSSMRGLSVESLTLQRAGALDDVGRVTYDPTSVTFDAHAVLEKRAVRLPDGSEVRSDLTIYVAPDEAVVPNERDRVIRNSIDYIALEKTEPLDLRSGEIDHYRIRCREESADG